MKTLLKHNLIPAIIAFALLFPACQSGKKKSEKSQETTLSSQDIDRAQIEKDVREFVYPLPSTFEVTEMLNRIGAGYILTLSNQPSSVTKYLTEKKQALNLGVYGADLSYASTYNQKQETMNYIEAHKKLVDALNVSPAIPSDIVEQVEQNQDNKEELIEIITNTFYSTYDYLNTNNRAGVSMLVLAGSWVEALYVVTHISEDTWQNKEMIKIVMEQKASLNTLIDLMRTQQEDERVQEVLKQMQPLQDVYNKVEGNAITEEQMNTITKEVRKVREEFVK